MAESSLQFVFGIVRHGIRSPVFSSYPTDPYRNYSKYFQEGDGALTKAGKQLMHRVGKMIRQRYDDFLGPLYFSDKVQFVSTNMERTMMSAMLVSNGMFPPQSYQQWSENVNWQPIPIWLDNNEMDKTLLFVNSLSCPPFANDLSKILKKAKQLDQTPDHSALYEYISDHAGERVNSTYALLALWDILECEVLNGYELPNWTVDVYPDKLRPFAIEKFSSMVNETKLMSRLLSGPIMFTLHGLLMDKVNGSKVQERKMYLHSGHDTTVLGLLNGIGYQLGIVRPGDCVFVELHALSQSYHLKIFYYDATNNHMKEVLLPLCPSPCSLSHFLRVTEPLSPQQWQDMCRE